MSLPPANLIQVATVALPAYTARIAAIQASQGTSSPLPEINFSEAVVLVGDGNGDIPSISTLQSTGALVHQVWSGQIVQSVSLDANNSNQVDILCVIPAVDGSGNEIGPFWVTEFIITDENAVPMIAGVTLMPKLVTANGASTDLSFIGAAAFAPGTVNMAAPSAAFLTTSEAASAVAALLSAAAPLELATSVQSNGWTAWALSVLAATNAQVGVGRPATNAEFAAGVPAASPAYQFPWPTLQQLVAAITAVPTSGRLLRTSVYSLVGGVQHVSVNGGASTTVGATTFTALSATNAVEVEVQGGGAAGGGSIGASSSTVTMGAPGSAGANAWDWLTSGFSGGITVTVGAGGDGVNTGSGGNGGTSSFGSLITAPGGHNGGSYGLSTPPLSYGGQVSAIATGGAINSAGAPGGVSLATATNFGYGGEGGASRFGAGGSATSANTAGNSAAAPGAGGGGTCVTASGSAKAGGSGAAGLVIVREYA